MRLSFKIQDWRRTDANWRRTVILTFRSGSGPAGLENPIILSTDATGTICNGFVVVGNEFEAVDIASFSEPPEMPEAMKSEDVSTRASTTEMSTKAE